MVIAATDRNLAFAVPLYMSASKCRRRCGAMEAFFPGHYAYGIGEASGRGLRSLLGKPRKWQGRDAPRSAAPPAASLGGLARVELRDLADLLLRERAHHVAHLRVAVVRA